MQLTNKHLSIIAILLIIILIIFSFGIFKKHKNNVSPPRDEKTITENKESEPIENKEETSEDIIEADNDLPPINVEIIYPDWNVYAHEDYRFSVQIPFDWKIDETKQETLFAVFLESPDYNFENIGDEPSPDQNITPQINIESGIRLFVSADLLKNYGLKNYEEIISFYKNFDEVFQKPEIFSYEDIDGREALISKNYQGKYISAGKNKLIEIIARGKKFSFQFTFDDTDKANEEIIDQIIDSIRLY